MADKIYVLLDAMGIQSYIFATNKLKIILGSSLALDKWQHECKKIAEKNEGEIITSAGGNVLASFSDKANAAKFKDDCFAEDVSPPEMDIAWAITEVNAGKDNNRTEHIWNKLQVLVSRYKAGDRRGDDVYPAKPFPDVPGCLFCGVRPKSDELSKKSEMAICDRCHELDNRSYLIHKAKGHQKAKKPGLESTGLYRLTTFSQYALLRGDYPTDLKHLVSLDETKFDAVKTNQEDIATDLLAAVVIDLNNIGNRIRKTIKDGFPALNEFSKKLNNDIMACIEDCIRDLDKLKINSWKEKVPIRPLVAAGDDLIFLLPARFWVSFTKNMLGRLAGLGYPACAGAAIAKHTFPVNRLVLMAEELCGNGKQYIRYLNDKSESNLQNSDQCAIDWYIHQETTMTDPLGIRKRKSRIDMSKYEFAVKTQKPYNLPEFTKLKEEKERWDDIEKKSNRKLYSLYSALQNGPQQTRDELKYTFFRREKEDLSNYTPIWDNICANEGDYPLWKKQEITENQPNRTIHSTRIIDMLELRWLAQEPGENSND